MADEALEEGEIAGELNSLPECAAEQEEAVSPPQPEDDQGGNVPGNKPLKRRKLSKLAGAAVSAFSSFVNVYGDDARADVKLSYAHPIRLPDLQGLLLWILAEGLNPKWAFVQNKPLISKVTLVAVPGLSADLYKASKAWLPTLASLPQQPVTLLAKNAMVRPGQTVAAIFAVPHSKKRKKYLEALKAGMDANDASKDNGEAAQEQKSSKPKKQPFPPKHYIATLDNLKSSEYPLPVVGPTGELACPEGYIATRPGPKGDEDPALIGLDCEMCVTEEGFELTRISLVDEQGQVLLDELVVPDNPITDYNTRFSGITAEMLAPVTTRLPDIQAKFLELVPAEALLVGHALQNDLKALKILHANIIDTAFLFPHPKGPPYRSALRKLTEKFLKRQIQNGSHDSIDDARAAMELALLKFRHGPAFGDAAAEERDGDPLCEVLAAAGRRCSLADRPDVLSRHVTGNSHAFVCNDDEECTVAAAKEARNPATNFLWTQLRALSTLLEQRSWHRRALTRAEVAAGLQPTANGHTPLQASEAGPVVIEDLATPLDLDDESEEGELEAAPVQKAGQQHQNGRLKRKQDALVSHPIEISPDKAAAGTPEEAPLTEESAVCDSASAEPATAAADAAAAPSCNGGEAHVSARHTEPAATAKAGEGTADPGQATGVPETTAASPEAVLAKEREVAAADEAAMEQILKQLDERLGRIYAALPPNAMLIVAAGQGDTAEVRRLQEQKWRRQQGLDGLPPWSVESEGLLAEAMVNALHGLCFCTVKH
ncbi:Small RNA degrading nuclease 5 [Coccomyxa sp. Obi]|nr:Small RNA degrading nuclease 5 [Coccomyxa sp. Obi]